jgi:hypothetical protein
MRIFETTWAISIVLILVGILIFHRNRYVDAKILRVRDIGSFLIVIGVVLGFYISIEFLREIWNMYVQAQAMGLN